MMMQQIDDETTRLSLLRRAIEAWRADQSNDFRHSFPFNRINYIIGGQLKLLPPEEARDVNFNPCGQIIGRATSVRRTKDVVLDMVEEYIDAVQGLQLVKD